MTSSDLSGAAATAATAYMVSLSEQNALRLAKVMAFWREVDAARQRTTVPGLMLPRLDFHYSTSSVGARVGAHDSSRRSTRMCGWWTLPSRRRTHRRRTRAATPAPAALDAAVGAAAAAVPSRGVIAAVPAIPAAAAAAAASGLHLRYALPLAPAAGRRQRRRGRPPVGAAAGTPPFPALWAGLRGRELCLLVVVGLLKVGVQKVVTDDVSVVAAVRVDVRTVWDGRTWYGAVATGVAGALRPVLQPPSLSLLW